MTCLVQIQQPSVWPCEPVRELLDEPWASKLREGFVHGTLSKRGVTSRHPYEGGDQERELAAMYRQHAEALCTSHPRTASALTRLVDYYNHDALREDIDARLSRVVATYRSLAAERVYHFGIR